MIFIEGGKSVYPRYQRPMQSRMAPRPFDPYRISMMNPMMMGNSRQPHQRGGGILSKLLGRANQTGAGQSFNPYSFGIQQGAASRGSGSLIKTLTNPSSINSFLVNTQKVLNTAQQVGPLVQQYGPIVKNLPVMWKLYRGLKNAPEFSENTESNSTTNEEQDNQNSIPINNTETQEIDSPTGPSPSKPKLYI